MIKLHENKRWWISLRKLSKTSMCTQAWWRVLWLELLPPLLQLARFFISKIHVKPTFQILGWWPDQASGRGERAGGCWSACLSWSSHSFSWRGNSFHGCWNKFSLSDDISNHCILTYQAQDDPLSRRLAALREWAVSSLAKLSRHQCLILHNVWINVIPSQFLSYMWYSHYLLKHLDHTPVSCHWPYEEWYLYMIYTPTVDLVYIYIWRPSFTYY